MKSIKKNLDKQFLILWGCVAIILVVSLIVVGIKYSPIKKGQDFIITVMQEEYGMFDDSDSRGERLDYLFDYFLGGGYLSSATRSDLNDEFGDVLESMGYRPKNCKSYEYDDARSYLIEGTFFEYFLKHYVISIGNAVLILAVGFMHLQYITEKKMELVVNDDSVVAKKKNGQSVEFLLKDIKSVETTKSNGLIVVGTGIKYKINQITNGEEIKKSIMDMLAKMPKAESTVVVPTSDAKSIKEYKELLDAGIITQEEFDAKKKQLLGL